MTTASAITAASAFGIVGVLIGAAIWLSRLSGKAAETSFATADATLATETEALQEKASQAQADAVTSSDKLEQALENGKF